MPDTAWFINANALLKISERDELTSDVVYGYKVRLMTLALGSSLLIRTASNDEFVQLIASDEKPLECICCFNQMYDSFDIKIFAEPSKYMCCSDVKDRSL